MISTAGKAAAFPVFYRTPESLHDTDREIAGNSSVRFRLLRHKRIQPQDKG